MAIFPLHYFPCVAWLAAVFRQPVIYLDPHKPYQKQQYSSRAFIKTANQVTTLTLPVERRSKHAPLSQKALTFQEKWAGNHLRSIRFAYQHSPYFAFFEDELADLYATPPANLAEWNVATTRFLLTGLQWEGEIRLLENAVDIGTKPLDFRGAFDPTRHEVPDWFAAAPYEQVFPGFDPNLSGLDLLFNLGLEARLYLQASAKPEKFP